MAQRAIDFSRAKGSFQAPSQGVPSLGMRGGLGKNLLIAFLLLAIVPLGLLALFTNNQIQHDTRQKLVASLETMLALKDAHLMNWVTGYERELSLLAGAPGLEPGGMSESTSLMRAEGLARILSTWLATMQANDLAPVGLILGELSTDQVIATAGEADADFQVLLPSVMDGRRLLIVPPSLPDSFPLLVVSYTWDDRRLIGLLRWDSLQQIVTESDDPEQGVITSLVTDDGLVVSVEGLIPLPEDEMETLPLGISQALQGQSGSGAYIDLEGVPVFGAYRWNPDLQIALLAKQSQTQVLAAANALTAVVVGVTLAVALITAAIAAIVTRRITRPLVQLTETAAWMARGDLDQQVSITRRDEIGILARAFNRMATDLRILYENLEAKVAERTQQLEAANERILHHVMQLALSAEVARIATSIRDMNSLLTTATELLRDAFELHHVAIYLLDEKGIWAVWQASSDAPSPLPERERVGGPTLVGCVAADGQRRVVRASQSARQLQKPVSDCEKPEKLPSSVMCEMGVPLFAREQVVGVLYMQSRRPKDFGENDQMVYQSLADQISVALKNAQAYALEREAIERLQELDRIQSQFLTNMSHALRTPLNSVIGFSRVVLKELDGPLTDLQRTDLTTIYEGGRQLLGLINDMLDLSHLELGTAPFSLTEVDLAEIIVGVMATARALALRKPIQLYAEVPEDLPLLYTDGQRLRQVILALLSNAVKFTDEGSIRLEVTTDNKHVIISVHDTGIGIPEAERAGVFSNTRYGEGDDEGVSGFGLAISKQVVERLGGQIWMESEQGRGSTFTFTLPIRLDDVGLLEGQGTL